MRVQSRWIQQSSDIPAPTEPKVPSPTPFVPDVATFLKLIGREMGQYTSKFPTWEALFTLTSKQLRQLGVEPARQRRYLLAWRNKYNLGLFGPGGDIRHIEDGKAVLKVFYDETDPLRPRKYVVNVPADKANEQIAEEDRIKIKGFTVQGAHTVSGPYALPTKGKGLAQLALTEGMWAHKRGRKIDGGERRQAEVRFKKRIEERKAAREALQQ